MASRTIVMRLLLAHDLGDGLDSCLIGRAKRGNLLFEVAQNYPLDGNCGGRNGPRAEKAGDEAEGIAADTAEVIAAAAPNAAPLKFGEKDGAMATLMRLELGEFTQQMASR